MGLFAMLFPEDRPSPLWCLVGIALNCAIAGIGFTVTGSNRHEVNGFTFYSDCRRPETWIDYTVLIALANIAFLLHLANKMYRTKETKDTLLGSPKGDADRPVMKVLVYDIGVYIYTLFFIFVVVWSCVPADGPSWAGGKAPEYRLPACSKYNDKVRSIRIVLWAYEGFCLFSILIFLCCPINLASRMCSKKAVAEEHQSRDCELSLMGYPCHYLEDEGQELEAM